MNVTVPIPDAFAARFGSDADLGRLALEALVLEAFRAERIGVADVKDILGFPTRFEVDGFLKAHGCVDGYTMTDLEQDRQTLDRLGI